MLCVHCGSDSIGELDDRCMKCGKTGVSTKFDGRKPESHLLSTPSKSPVPKRLKGDEALGDDDEAMASGQEHQSSSDDLQLNQMMKIMMLDMKEMKGKMATKEDMEQMATKEDVRLLKAGIEDAKATAQTACKAADGAMIKVDDLTAHFSELQGKVVTKDDARKMVQEEVAKVVDSVKPASAAPSLSNEAVFGNLKGLSNLQEAEEWIRKELADMKAPTPLRVYMKSDKFAGLAFARFPGADDVTKVVNMVRAKTLQCKGHAVWAAMERPLSIRAPFRFFLQFKRLLQQPGWDYTKRAVRVDEDTATLKVGGVPILQASSADGVLKMNWVDKEWEQWSDLQQDKEFLALVTTCNEALAKAKQGQGKGEGKGQ